MPHLCPHDRLAPHCMWCLADLLACEQQAVARLVEAAQGAIQGAEDEPPLQDGRGEA